MRSGPRALPADQVRPAFLFVRQVLGLPYLAHDATGETEVPEALTNLARPTSLGASIVAALARIMAVLSGATARKGVWALVDQAVVSGTSFLTTVIIGRICGAGDLGVFSLGFGSLLILAGVQQSLILSPYIVYSNRFKGRSLGVYAGSVLLQQGLLSAAGAALLALGAAACLFIAEGPRLVAVLTILAVVMPFFSLRQFVRCMMIARLDMAKALVFDVAVAALQVGGFLALMLSGVLTAESACLVIGIACAVPTAAWFVFTKKKFTTRNRWALRHLGLHWSFGKWMCASQLTDMGQRYALFWLLAGLLGAGMTGVYVACNSVVRVFTPIILGLGSVLAPRTAQAYSSGGSAEVKRVVWKVTILLGVTMAVACAGLALCGNLCLHVLFGSDEYGGYGAVVALLALSTFLSAISFPVDNGLWVMGRADLNFWAGLWGLVITLAASALFVPWWGILGAALGGSLGHAAASTLQFVYFFRLCRSGLPTGRRCD
jgi:O-antigen/teichoic acid export membrane protein